ncbi:MAG: PPOX class F420-dependent oxidoreductase [Dehalococcoidia bacterium]|nr:PPOX class F420-dependent oxidoreductase [Dehalococcoidia bacterium]
MSAKLSPKAIDLLNRPVLAHLATLMKDGSPQVTPVWVDTDGVNIFINTEQGRLKARNMKRDPRVALSIVDNVERQYNLFVRGTVTEISGPKGGEHYFETLAKKYIPSGRRPNNNPGDVRVKVTIRPDKVAGSAA